MKIQEVPCNHATFEHRRQVFRCSSVLACGWSDVITPTVDATDVQTMEKNGFNDSALHFIINTIQTAHRDNM